MKLLTTQWSEALWSFCPLMSKHSNRHHFQKHQVNRHSSPWDKFLHPHKVTGKYIYFYISTSLFSHSGQKIKGLCKLCGNHYTNLIPSQFLGNMTCIYFQSYHSFTLSHNNLPVTVWHWRKAGPTTEFPMSVVSGAYTVSITYLAIPKLYWAQWMNTNHPTKNSKQVNL
jgi:hypothetical protein